MEAGMGTSGTFTTGGGVTLSSDPTVECTSAGIWTNDAVSGSNIPANSYVGTINTGTEGTSVESFELKDAAGDPVNTTGAATGLTLTFTPGLRGNYNTTVGVKAGRVLRTTAARNTIVGALAGDTLRYGLYNTLIGYAAGGALTTGNTNCVVGYQAGTALTTSQENTFLGTYAGDTITTGRDNVILGYAADGAAGNNDQIAIGHSATCSANDTIAIGNNADATAQNAIAVGDDTLASAVDAIVIGNDITNSTTETFMWGASGKTVITSDFDTSLVAFSQSSDIRKKTNIKDDNLGLEFINKLRNVSFQWKPRNEYPKEWNDYNKENDIDTETIHHGFIAQEVKQSLEECGVDISQKDGIWSEDADGMQRLANGKLVLPLVKAVQELSAQVEELKSKLGE